MIYLDTGCLLKLYFPEPESERIAKLVSNELIGYTGLHELEFRNALELKALRKEATPAQVKATLELVDEDVRTGILHRSSPEWEMLYKQATAFAAAYSKTLARSLDILHRAAAVVLGESIFITTDERQKRLALKVGLRCPAIRAR